MERPLTNSERKVLVGFKCNPSLRLALCERAEKLDVTLSSHVETIVSTQENKQNDILKLSKEVNALKERITFYENPFLTELYEEYKGKTISFKNRAGETVNQTINSIKDVFTVIINSFKTKK